MISDLREAEERAEREWREALRGQNQSIAQKNFYCISRHAASH